MLAKLEGYLRTVDKTACKTGASGRITACE
jgi:hypothetical protein